MTEIGSFLELNVDIVEACDKGKDVISFLSKTVRGGFGIGFYDSGRSAIRALLDEDEAGWDKENDVNRRVLLPAYLCHSVEDVFTRSGWEIFHYSLNKDLMPDKDELFEKLEGLNIRILLIHPYYGRDSYGHIRKQLYSGREKFGYRIAEDVTQSLYMSGISDADYIFASLRKWFPVPDGGFLISRRTRYSNLENTKYVRLQLQAMEEKHRYILTGNGKKEKYLNTHTKAEELLENENICYGISDFSREILGKIDYDYFMSQRQKNANYLVRNIPEGRVQLNRTEYQNDEVPLYVPIWAENREVIQKYIAQSGIYLSVLWGLNNKDVLSGMADADRWHYSNLLAVPCDYRYSERDMQYVCKCFQKCDEVSLKK